MGMINHRHDILKRESQALWRVVLQEGGQRLTEKAIYALRQIVSVSAEGRPGFGRVALLVLSCQALSGLLRCRAAPCGLSGRSFACCGIC